MSCDIPTLEPAAFKLCTSGEQSNCNAIKNIGYVFRESVIDGMGRPPQRAMHVHTILKQRMMTLQTNAEVYCIPLTLTPAWFTTHDWKVGLLEELQQLYAQNEENIA